MHFTCAFYSAFLEAGGMYATVLSLFFFLGSLTLKTEKELRSSKTAVTVYQSMWRRNMPQDLVLHQKTLLVH